jgi:iduronate 2-sulfatase
MKEESKVAIVTGASSGIGMETAFALVRHGYSVVLAARLVEFVDIYPSLCELTGMATPDHVQGKSFVPLMNNPKQEWKSAVFAKWSGCQAVKTDRYLYTEWRKGQKVTHRMLFDHKTDPQENTNIAAAPEAKETVDKLSKLLQAGWKSIK